MLAQRIREIAAEKGVPLSHIPDRAGVARSHFYTVLGERGAATVDWIEQIAAALGCEPSDLLCRH